jgi:lipase
VTCLHDVRGHARRFDRLVRMLDDGRHTIAYDLRGHGFSPWSGPHSIAQHVLDLDEVLASCGVDQTGLIGEGLGARIAISYAVRRQERITSLTLLDPPISPPWELMEQAAIDEVHGVDFASVDEAIDARRRAEQLRHTPRALLEEEMAEHLVADGDGRYRYRYSHVAAAAAFHAMAAAETELGELLCPTLVIHGEDSVQLSETEVDQAAEAIRRCRRETVPGGHAVLWDALAETGAHVRSFLVAKKTA